MLFRSSGGGLFGLSANAAQNIVGDNQYYPLAVGTTGTVSLIFGTANTERMRITSGGNVLVGTTTDAGYKLDVNGTGRFSYTGSANQYPTLLALNNSVGGSPAGVKLELQFGGTEITSLDAYYDGTFKSRLNAYNSLLFRVNGSSSFVDALTIASSGAATFSSSVTATNGIFTGSGIEIASNSGGNNSTFKFNYTANASSRSWRLANDYDAYGDFQIQQSTTQTGSTYSKILGFSSTGAATFSSSVTAGGNFILSGNSNSFATASIFRNSNRVFFGGDTGGYYFQNSGNTATTFFISDAGNVGIGTTSPIDKLTVYAAGQYPTNIGDNVYLGVANDGGSAGNMHQIGFGYNSGSAGNYYPAIIGGISESSSGQTNEGLFFATRSATSGTTRPTERMRITSGGELLINTTSDAGDYKLQVNGSIYSTGTTTASIGYITNNTTANRIHRAYTDISGNYIIYDATSDKNGLVLAPTTTNATFGGSIKTAAPSGYTAQPWKLGDVTDTSITLNSQYISVEINGVVYNIPTCHPN